MESSFPSTSAAVSEIPTNKESQRNKKERAYYPIRLVASKKSGKLYARLKSSPSKRIKNGRGTNIIRETVHQPTKETRGNNSDVEWSFFETADTAKIVSSIYARKTFYPEYADSFYHLAKAPSCQGMRYSRVSFSRFQSTFIIQFLNEILRQAKKVHRGEIIPFFKYRPNRVYDQLTPDNRQKFWADADLNYCNIRIKVSMCQITGLPVCFINNPRSERANYPGQENFDTICLRIPHIEELVQWLILKNQEPESATK